MNNVCTADVGDWQPPGESPGSLRKKKEKKKRKNWWVFFHEINVVRFTVDLATSYGNVELGIFTFFLQI